MSLYAELNPEDPLLDSDDASRYCSPNDYDRRRCEPKVSAFQRKPSERNPLRDPSINRLQFFQLPDQESAVKCVRREFLSMNYGLRRNGRFVVFNVGEAKAAALKSGCQLFFIYDPDPPVYSHSLISNLPEDTSKERVVATAIKRLVTKSGMTYLALP